MNATPFASEASNMVGCSHEKKDLQRHLRHPISLRLDTQIPQKGKKGNDKFAKYF